MIAFLSYSLLVVLVFCRIANTTRRYYIGEDNITQTYIRLRRIYILISQKGFVVEACWLDFQVVLVVGALQKITKSKNVMFFYFCLHRGRWIQKQSKECIMTSFLGEITSVVLSKSRLAQVLLNYFRNTFQVNETRSQRSSNSVLYYCHIF